MAPKVPGRTTPSFAFGYIERAIQEGFGRREFDQREVRQAVEFFGEPLACVFCGGSNVTRWDHLVPVISGGETVLGNMVPACGKCDDSKHSRPFDEWLRVRLTSAEPAVASPDVETRIERLREYVRRFGYTATTLDSRLTPDALARVNDLRRRADELRRDVEAALASAEALALRERRDRSRPRGRSGSTTTPDDDARRLAKNAALRAWRKRNPEHVAAYMKRWYEQRRLKAASAARKAEPAT